MAVHRRQIDVPMVPHRGAAIYDDKTPTERARPWSTPRLAAICGFGMSATESADQPFYPIGLA
jgi:hypothetical protein